MQGKTSKVSAEKTSGQLPRESELAALNRRITDLDQREDALRAGIEHLIELAKSRPLTQGTEVRIRTDFIRYSGPPSTGSDRKKPPPEALPPSIRLITSRGSSLRFLLIALFVAQCETRPGNRPRNERPLVGSGSTVGWKDLFAPSAKPRGGGGNSYLNAADLNSRQVTRNLERIRDLGLVDFPNGSASRNKPEGFLLMHEGGLRAGGGNEAYTVPKLSEDIFSLPEEFFTNGWVYTLEETEIALVLIAASRFDKDNPAGFRLTADERINEYGLVPNTYDRHLALQALELLDVQHGRGRYANGQIVDYDEKARKIPNLLQFRPEGLQRDSIDVRKKWLEERIAQNKMSGTLR